MFIYLSDYHLLKTHHFPGLVLAARDTEKCKTSPLSVKPLWCGGGHDHADGLSIAHPSNTRTPSTRDVLVVEWKVVLAQCRRKNRSELNDGCKSEVVIPCCQFPGA